MGVLSLRPATTPTIPSEALAAGGQAIKEAMNRASVPDAACRWKAQPLHLERLSIMKSYLSRLSLRAKFFVAPAVVLLCLCVVSILAYAGLAKQRDTIDEIHTRRFAMYKSSVDLLRGLSRVHEGMLRVMTWSSVGYSDQRINAEVADQVQRLDATKVSVKEVLARPYLLPEEASAYQGLDQPLTEYRMWCLRVMDMANSDMATAAVYLGTAELKFTALKGVLTKLEDLESQSNDRYYTSAMAVYRRTLFVLFLGIGCAVVVAIVTTVFMTRLITRRVNCVVSELAAITDGQWDLTRRIPVESNDEISVMTVGINSFIT